MQSSTVVVVCTDLYVGSVLVQHADALNVELKSASRKAAQAQRRQLQCCWPVVNSNEMCHRPHTVRTRFAIQGNRAQVQAKG